MKTLFDTPLVFETSHALEKYPTVSKMLTEYRKVMYSAVGAIDNFMYPYHVVESAVDQWGNSHYTNTTPKYRSNIVGAALDETIANNLKLAFNTRKWLKMFGGFGAGLFSVTVLSQFFFGHSGNNYQKTEKKV